MAFVLIPSSSGRLVSDDGGITMTYQIIIIVLKIVLTGERIVYVSIRLVFGLHRQHKQLQASPAATRSHQELVQCG